MFGGSEAAGEAGFLSGRGDRIRLAYGGRHEQKKSRERRRKKGEISAEREGSFLEEADGFFGGSLESFHESLKSGELSLVRRFFQVWILLVIFFVCFWISSLVLGKSFQVVFLAFNDL